MEGAGHCAMASNFIFNFAEDDFFRDHRNFEGILHSYFTPLLNSFLFTPIPFGVKFLRTPLLSTRSHMLFQTPQIVTESGICLSAGHLMCINEIQFY